VCDECTHLFLSVRPDWRDSKALLGYYNPLKHDPSKRELECYESTGLLKFLLRAKGEFEEYEQKKRKEEELHPYFVILDEMNLAHVEYYFADFLSVLESGREEGWTKEALRLHSFGKSILDQDGYPVPPELRLPPNLYIIGTVNIDETTYMFSPKVLDRAFTLEFREVDFSDYLGEGVNEEEARKIAEEIRGKILEDLRNGGKFCAVVADKNKVKEALQDLGGKKTELEKLNRTLQPYDLHFGYRVLDEIALFVQNAKNAPDVVGRLNEDKALDYAVLMKVLPKFHGPRQKLEKPLREVLRWAQNRDDSNKDAPSWVGNPDEAIDLRKISEALQNWEPPKQPQDQAQPATEQAENKPEGRAEQTANAQQEQGNQTETTPTQAAQGEAKGQSDASTEQSFKSHFRYPNTAKKVLQMLRQLYETGFASFAQ
jgi:5-methylcytosine-specific restriction endonuclease McrBC GTP-binding regulatory subunit McrB